MFWGKEEQTIEEIERDIKECLNVFLLYRNDEHATQMVDGLIESLKDADDDEQRDIHRERLIPIFRNYVEDCEAFQFTRMSYHHAKKFLGDAV